ncbi:MAG: FAD-binding domain-containing protein, partial [Pseudomonadota bacterium]
LRPEPNDPERLERFAEGRTGYPFVDACMRSLHAVGWINFRMRAMLMSFASYDLWLPWQRTGTVLARLFTDYEPGIHWTQAQMQSGETGINAVRIYSPIKQSYDQDPDGAFIRRWVPELAHLSGKDLHEPWRLDALPDGYPERIVDHASAAREAKSRIYTVRRQADARAEAEDVFQRHGSRKPRRTRTPPRRAATRKEGKAA